MRERIKYAKYKSNKDKKTYFNPLKYPEIPLSSSDVYVLTLDGDRLDLIADQFYSDTRLWWIIANANTDIVRRDSYNIPGGLEIIIPLNINNILNSFKALNK